MELTKKEKKLLTILHEARVIGGNLLKDYKQELRGHISFKKEDLRKAIKKFLELGLIKELKLKDKEVMYFFTDKVRDEMIDKNLINIGCSNNENLILKNLRKLILK